jgi:hypothetical protein
VKPSRTPRPQLTAFQRYVLHQDCPICNGARKQYGCTATGWGIVMLPCTFYGNGGRPFLEPERVQEPGANAIARYKVLSVSRGACAMREAVKRKH